MIALMENFYNQIVCQDLLKKDNKQKRVQASFKSFTYSYLDLNVKNFRADQRRLKVFYYLKEAGME